MSRQPAPGDSQHGSEGASLQDQRGWGVEQTGLSRQGSVAEPSRRRLPSPTKRQPYNQPQAVPSPHRCSVGCGRGQGASGVAQPRGAWRQERAKPCRTGVPLPDSALGGGVEGAGGWDPQGQEGRMGLRSPALQPWDTPRHVAPSFARGKAWGPLPRPSSQPPRCGRLRCGPRDGLLLPRRPAVEAVAPVASPLGGNPIPVPPPRAAEHRGHAASD